MSFVRIPQNSIVSTFSSRGHADTHSSLRPESRRTIVLGRRLARSCSARKHVRLRRVRVRCPGKRVAIEAGRCSRGLVDLRGADASAGGGEARYRADVSAVRLRARSTSCDVSRVVSHTWAQICFGEGSTARNKAWVRGKARRRTDRACPAGTRLFPGGRGFGGAIWRAGATWSRSVGRSGEGGISRPP